MPKIPHLSQGKRNRSSDMRPKRYPDGWQQLSEAYRRGNPLCERCMDHGRTTPAEDTHHKIKVSERPDLALDPANLMAVCRVCHLILDRS